MHKLAIVAFLLAAQPPRLSQRVPPFTYTNVAKSGIPGLFPDTWDNVRSCTLNWEVFHDERSDVFATINNTGFFRKAHSILLEIGNAGFGHYGYAAVVDGALVDVPGAWTDLAADIVQTASIRRAWESIDDISVVRMRGTASAAVFDGPCYFLTVTLRRGGFRQIAIYGPPSGAAFSGKLVNQLLPFVREVRARRDGESR